MTKPSTTTQETRELEPWSRELPSKCGWYFMRNEGETPLAEGMIVWVGHNRSGVRYEGEFFYSDHPFLKRREFLGPVTIESLNSAPSDTEQVIRLREALEEADRDREKMIDEIGYWRAYAESEAGRALEDYDAERDGDFHGETE
jgi:hypothetical protein